MGKTIKESMRLAHNHAVRLKRELENIGKQDAELFDRIAEFTEEYSLTLKDIDGMIEKLKKEYAAKDKNQS